MWVEFRCNLLVEGNEGINFQYLDHELRTALLNMQDVQAIENTAFFLERRG